MPRNYHIDLKIIETLKERPLSIKETISKIKGGSDDAPSSDDTYYKGFNNLLDSGKIIIVGYIVPNSGKRYTMPKENLIVGLVKKEPIEIFHLLKQLDENDYGKAYERLNNLFKTKIEKIETNNQNEWEALINSVVVRGPKLEDLIYLEGETELDAFIMSYSYLMPEMWEMDGIYDKSEEYRGKMLELKEKYSEAKVYYLKNPKNKKKEIHPLIERILNAPLGEDDLGKEILLKDEVSDDVYHEKELSRDGEVDKERYLNSLGFETPKEMSYRELNKLFGEIISYVHSQDPIQPAMQKLSRALSDDVNSIELLKELISEAKNKTD